MFHYYKLFDTVQQTKGTGLQMSPNLPLSPLVFNISFNLLKPQRWWCHCRLIY